MFAGAKSRPAVVSDNPESLHMIIRLDRWSCDYPGCKTEYDLGQTRVPGTKPIRLDKPSGWTTINDQSYCQHHKVVISVEDTCSP
jgi:hypothetical protein